LLLLACARTGASLGVSVVYLDQVAHRVHHAACLLTVLDLDRVADATQAE
jgi:hypothetical protein